MAYITAKETRAIKKKLVESFPDFKFSVRNEHHSSVAVTILSGPVRFNYTEEARRTSASMYNVTSEKEPDYLQLNHYYLENYTNANILHEMYDILNDGNYDNSEPMTDYFDVGFYVNLSMGSWDKPYILTS